MLDRPLSRDEIRDIFRHHREEVQDFLEHNPDEVKDLLKQNPNLLPWPARWLASVPNVFGYGMFSFLPLAVLASTVVFAPQQASYKSVPVQLLTDDQYWKALEQCTQTFHSLREDPSVKVAVWFENDMVFKVSFRGRGARLATESDANFENIELLVFFTRQVSNAERIQAHVVVITARQTPWDKVTPPNDALYKPFEPAQLLKLESFVSDLSSHLSRCIGRPA